MNESAHADEPRPASSPVDEDFFRQLRRIPVRALAREIFRESRANDLFGSAAEIAYHALFSVVPMIVTLTAVAALLNHYTEIAVRQHLLVIVYRSAPAETATLLRSFVDVAIDQVGVGFASFSVVLALTLAIWASSNAIIGVFKALNKAFNVRETRSGLRVRLVGLILAITMPTIVVLAFILWVFGHNLGGWLTGQIGAGETFSIIWNFLRWPLAVGILLVQLVLIYYVGPNVEHSVWWVLPGAISATGLWFLTVFSFKIYLFLVNAGTAYGAFSSVIFLLTLLYLTAAIFLLGGEITAALSRRYDPVTIRHLVAQPDKLANVEAIVAFRERARAFDQDSGTNYADRVPAPASALFLILERRDSTPADVAQSADTDDASTRQTTSRP